MSKPSSLLVFFAFAILCINGLLLVGCGKKSDLESWQGSSQSTSSRLTNEADTLASIDSMNAVLPGMQASPLESTNILRSFVARGVIRDLPTGGQTVVIRHEDIPGFMPKMTMEFTVRDTNVLRGFASGDAITFRVRANQTESWIEDLQHAIASGLVSVLPSDPPSSTLLHVAKLNSGDVLPDAELLAEDGRMIRFSDFRGQALAFTFLFTRCPLPDFCPRMNQNFSRARELLAQRSDGPTNWQFLSISFDSEFDGPGVLTRYASSYRGPSTNGWLFAVAPTKVMASLVSQLDFRFANESGSFVHNLRTVVLDPRRRVYRQFDGNKWSAEELAQAITEAARSGTP